MVKVSTCRPNKTQFPVGRHGNKAQATCFCRGCDSCRRTDARTGPHDGAPAGELKLPGDPTSESIGPDESLQIAHSVVSTSHATRQTLTGHELVKIPNPRPRTGRAPAERVDPRPPPVHTRLVRAPAKKPPGKAVGGGRDPQISSPTDYHKYIYNVLRTMRFITYCKPPSPHSHHHYMGWIDLSVKIITYSSVWLQHYEKG